MGDAGLTGRKANQKYVLFFFSGFLSVFFLKYFLVIYRRLYRQLNTFREDRRIRTNNNRSGSGRPEKSRIRNSVCNESDS
jgi:hypothetical protein